MKSAPANTKRQQKIPVVGVREKKMFLPALEVGVMLQDSPL